MPESKLKIKQQKALEGEMSERTGKLTAKEIQYIRDSPLPMRTLAKDFGVSLSLIYFIKKGERYAYVPEN